TSTAPDPPAGHTVAELDHNRFVSAFANADAFDTTGVTGTDAPAAGAAGTGHDGPCARAGNTTTADPTSTPHTAAASTRDRRSAPARQRRTNHNDIDTGMTPPRTQRTPKSATRPGSNATYGQRSPPHKM
ncbi:hypothetical protein ACFO1B_29745, partial [Dactylosporangium siamense]|uniref:hypothetical protein n=1 Tax=Dactylosporangium siamense TaxID=685454 RepID=UPI00361991E3